MSGYDDYFLGSIIVSKRDGRSYLVDGQQRVTSLTLLLIYLYNTAIKLKLPVASQIDRLIFSDSFGQPKFNLDIAERELVLKALFKSTPFNPEGQDESVQAMFARYSDILERDLEGELASTLPHFIYWLLAKVGLIEIATDNDSYASAIFETMNDRGKPLSPVDMLKAFLLAPIADGNKRKFVNQVWKQEINELISWNGAHDNDRDSACIKAWLRAQYADTIRDRRAGSSDKDGNWSAVSFIAGFVTT